MGRPAAALFVVAVATVSPWLVACGNSSGGGGEPECGDGQVDDGEACDDGNSEPRDGCSAVCELEDGWDCAGAPSQCEQVTPEAVCGDGRIAADEQCDDANRTGGDGCTRDCAVEDGWRCAGAPSRCTQQAPECGDGFIDAGESCDDSNDVSGDGCSAACAEEPGFDCTGEPSVCVARPPGVCGDGAIDVGELCDDGGTATGDGCDAACGVEPGYRCAGEPSVCETLPPICGDGLIALSEGCDDGNIVSGDGCGRSCVVEDGWVCTGTPSVCRRGADICAELDCSGLDGACTIGACDPVTGACVARPADGRSCDDGDPCTDGDVCSAGECAPGAALDCTELDGVCLVGVCDAPAGGCVAQPADEGASCDTGEGECTFGTCAAGACVASLASDCTPCGDGGALRCGGGICGGHSGTSVEGFEAETVPAEFVTSAPAWTLSTAQAHTGSRGLRSGTIGNNGTTTVTRAVNLRTTGEVRFWLFVSSESSFDELTFAIDGAELGTWSGNVAWRQQSYSLAAGAHTLSWTYSKDGSSTSGLDLAAIDDVEIGGGGPACVSDECAGAVVSNGESCVVCDAVEDGTACDEDTVNPCASSMCRAGRCEAAFAANGTSCDSDDGDCVVEACEEGVCTPAALPDCSGCEGGVCGGGVCGGLPPERRWGFDTAIPTGFTFSGAPWIVSGTAHTGPGAAASGDISDSGSSAMSTTVTVSAADASVSFWYRTSTESCCDKLRFRVDGTERSAWGGTIDWTLATFPLSAGTHTLEWAYTKDRSISTGEDTVYVDDVVVVVGGACDNECASSQVFNGDSCVVCETVADSTPCTADPSSDPQCTEFTCQAGACTEGLLADDTSCDAAAGECATGACRTGACTAIPVPTCTPCADGTQVCGAGVCGGLEPASFDGFEAAEVPAAYAVSGARPWAISTTSAHGGTRSLRSGAIGSSASTVVTRAVDLAVPGEVSFWARVSSEACCDRLNFRVDGTSLGQWGGIEWTELRFPLAAGPHTLSWTYSKDGTVNTGDDAAFIDDVRVTGLEPSCDAVPCAGETVYDGDRCVTCSPPVDGDPCEIVDPNPCLAYSCADGACVGEPVTDGTSCDVDATDCADNVCVRGVCVDEPLGDCTPCGAGGAGLCAAGLCDGVPGTLEYSFEGSTALPAGIDSAVPRWTNTDTSAHGGSRSMRAASIGNNASTSASVTVSVATAGEVRFWYRVSSEASYDYLRFKVDGTTVQSWAGEVAWAEHVRSLSAGTHTLTWTYEKDGSQTRGSDTAWVDDIVITGANPCRSDECGDARFDGSACVVCPVLTDGTACGGDGNPCKEFECARGSCTGTPVSDGTSCGTTGDDCTSALCVAGECDTVVADDCTPCGPSGASACVAGVCGGLADDYFEGFEAVDIPAEYVALTVDEWRTVSSQHHSGARAARSPTIGDNGSAAMGLAAAFPFDTTVSFWRRTSTETDYDFLRFYIDGVEQGRWSGVVDWTLASFPLSAGDHELVWAFTRDVSGSGGADAVWIDDVAIDDVLVCAGYDDLCSPVLFDGFDCVSCVFEDGHSCGDAGEVCDAGSCTP
ncbi:MAG: DUF4215 domain-containing protein [Myxococcales bacterium]|nr:DUF4215 domain-containing protein [Myxococcales bacterium]